MVIVILIFYVTIGFVVLLLAWFGLGCQGAFALGLLRQLQLVVLCSGLFCFVCLWFVDLALC